MDLSLKSQFLSLYHMILADGIIDARELETLYKIGMEQYHLTQEEITAVVRDAGSSFILPTTLQGKVQFLYNLAMIALADGTVDPEEKALLNKYITRMGFEDANADGIAEFLFESIRNDKSFDEIMSIINN